MTAIPLAGLRAEAKFSNFEIWRRPDCISPPNGAWAMGLASGLGSRSVDPLNGHTTGFLGGLDPLNGHTTGFLGGLGLLGGLAGSYVRWVYQRTKEFGRPSDQATRPI